MHACLYADSFRGKSGKLAQGTEGNDGRLTSFQGICSPSLVGYSIGSRIEWRQRKWLLGFIHRVRS